MQNIDVSYEVKNGPENQKLYNITMAIPVMVDGKQEYRHIRFFNLERLDNNDLRKRIKPVLDDIIRNLEKSHQSVSANLNGYTFNFKPYDPFSDLSTILWQGF